MKFMKLGSRPDTFYTVDGVRSVSTEVSSDLTIEVEGVKYLLHKFPLLSKCLRLQELCSQSSNSSQQQIVQLSEFPGGVEAFETCAKFCYGITITLSALNIAAVRCAAEYLQMTEDIEKGNLIYKLEVFLNSCLLRGWKDSISTLQSTKFIPFWSEDLEITSRCIDAVASSVLTRPMKMKQSRTYSGKNIQKEKPDSRGRWTEDIADLGIDLYWRTMLAIKSSGKVPAYLIGEALQIYASRWLPNISKEGYIKSQESLDPEITSKNRLLLESIVSLLPMEKCSVSCSFLLKLLKAANIIGASSSSKIELTKRAGMQLEEARVNDLLIPSLSNSKETLYDVDIVMKILEHFMMQGQSPPTSPPRIKRGFERRRSRSAENIDFEFQESRRSSSASHSSKLRVAKLVDGYLQEIARDVHMPLAKLIALAEAIPDFARIEHDDLYKAIDIYLKCHPELSKSERKRLCRILDCKKLSIKACMHAAQNELLPLRVVVQVLFCEQARAAVSGGQVPDLPNNIKALLVTHGEDPSKLLPPLSTTATDDNWSVSGTKSPKSKISTLRMKLAEEENDMDDVNDDTASRSSKLKNFCYIPVRPKWMLSKLWSSNRSTVSERH
ncbi:hypothetical protein GIB67_030924 [Kingdonia uniflora]|uniref:NPH3 domain-containing protein n=1 Tax=Kingdonia uniflora TaxID=39325 RepID=A0A7J7L3E1_9MAGN|nr:hypothetical protein GIB67_030924 [Kingdonia uniflora]